MQFPKNYHFLSTFVQGTKFRSFVHDDKFVYFCQLDADFNSLNSFGVLRVCVACMAVLVRVFILSLLACMAVLVCVSILAVLVACPFNCLDCSLDATSTFQECSTCLDNAIENANLCSRKSCLSCYGWFIALYVDCACMMCVQPRLNFNSVLLCFDRT